MTTKVVRGQKLTFTAAPIDYTGAAVTPDSIKVYINYPHADGTTSTDEPIEMEYQTDGTVWLAEFDTSDSTPGAAFASIRATNPPGAEDLKFTITANAANPASEST